MQSADGSEMSLRPTTADDLDFVMALERHPDNAPFVGQWTRQQHEAAIADRLREHWIIEDRATGRSVGFLIALSSRTQIANLQLPIPSERRLVN